MPSDQFEGTSWVWSRMPLLFLIGLAFFLGCFEMGNYDIWWHLRTGQLIPERGVPETDWYSFTSNENQWIDVHWGFQLIAAWVYGRFGVPGLIMMKALIGGLAFTICLTAFRRSMPATVQVLVWIPALLLMSSRFYERPEIFTLLFTAIFLSILFHAERHSRLVWLLPPIQVIWANFQGLFIFGPILFAMYAIEVVLRWNSCIQKLSRVLIVGVLLALACCVSPYGLRNVLLVFELWAKVSESAGPKAQAAQNIYGENIAELKPFGTFLAEGGIDNPYAIIVLLLLPLALVSIVVGWRAIVLERRVFRLLPLIGFGILGVLATRNGSHFALVTGTVICWNLASANWQIHWWSKRAVWLNTALVLVAWYVVVNGNWYLWTGGKRRHGFRMAPGSYAHSTMRLAGRDGMPTRAAIFHFGHAATYIFENGPRCQVLMDGRLEVHSEQMFRDFIKLENQIRDGANWDETLRRHDVDVVLADGQHNSAIQGALLTSPRWQCVDYNEVLALFVRRTTALPADVQRFEFRNMLFSQPGEIGAFNLPPPSKQPVWWLIPPETAFDDTTDFKATRAFHLFTALADNRRADPVLTQAVTWYTVRSALQAAKRRPWHPEPMRILGSVFVLAGNQTPMSNAANEIQRSGNATDHLLSMMGTHALRLALVRDPEDYVANFVLQRHLAAAGALDLSVEPLRVLVRLRPSNRLQTQFVPELAELLSKRESTVDEARSKEHVDDRTFAGRLRLAKAGLLGAALDNLNETGIADLPAEQAEVLANWYLTIGEPEPARTVFAGLLEEEPANEARWNTRLGMCDLIAGRYQSALQQFESIAAESPAFVEAQYGSAIIYLMAGRRDSARSAVERALDTEPAGETHTRLLEFDRLLRAPEVKE